MDQTTSLDCEGTALVNWRTIPMRTSLLQMTTTGKRRVTLMGLSFLLGVSLGAGGSVAMEMPPVPVHEYWKIDTGKSCHKTPRLEDVSGRPLPAPFEVLVFTGKNFTGACASIGPGLYPHSEYLGLSEYNDVTHSVRVGSLVRAVLFDDAPFASSPVFVGPGSEMNNLSFGLSSMRVEPAGRRDTDQESTSCKVLSGEITLISSNNDCITLLALQFIQGASGTVTQRILGEFPQTEYIGLKNDSIACIDTRKLDPRFAITVFEHHFYEGRSKTLPAGVFFNADDIRRLVGFGITSIKIVER
jgi:hypothetical protein